MYNLDSVVENETHKILWYFQIQIDHPISASRQDLVTVHKNSENLRYC